MFRTPYLHLEARVIPIKTRDIAYVIGFSRQSSNVKIKPRLETPPDYCAYLWVSQTIELFPAVFAAAYKHVDFHYCLPLTSAPHVSLSFYLRVIYPYVRG